jgi:hypothetical protein
MESCEIVSMLNTYFNWNKCRMNCFVGMLLALIKVRTINLTELACGFESLASIESRYKRIKRFFKEFTFDFTRLASWVIYFFNLNGQPLKLSMDRTNWKCGIKDINILMLSVVYKGIAIPLLWRLLNKRGNSDTAERIDMIDRFIRQFGKSAIEVLLADREFVGDVWFAWLLNEGIHFCIRIKSNCITTNARGLETTIDALFYDLKPGEQKILADKRKLWKQRVYLSGLRLVDGELLIVATDKLMVEPILTYGKRWEIECLFACLKSKGFNFEDTHITKLDRIEKLLALLTIAFCWAYKTGEWCNEQKKIKIKKHGRKAISYFRYGLDTLRDLVLNGITSMRHIGKTVSDFFILQLPTVAVK